MRREDRVAFISEMVRVTRPGGWIIVNFVHRYWNLTGFFKFIKNYWMWIIEKASLKKTELGDYVEKIGRTPVRFHAFTIREAKSLFPLDDVLRLDVWRRGRGIFTDWFFVVAEKKDLPDR